MQEKCPTVLIEDIPAEQDAFGPHERVASAIADLFESQERGGKVIGLEGGWGVGKSTVVNFLVKRLEANEDHAVISFDAWAHEGDPLRRTYLETLIKELCDKKWVDNKTWAKHRDEIANRRKETITRITPKPTKLGVVMAVSLFLVPLGTVFLSEGLRKGVAIKSDLPPNWPFIIGLLLSLSPFWVLAANFILICCRKFKRASPRDDQKDQSDSKDDHVGDWSFLFSRAINETRTETTDAQNPTSIEFEEYFTKLMRESLGASDSRKCLLVLDNLDRVDPESALEVWATLQTFLRDRTHRTEDWFKRLWVLVPYDPNGLRMLWEKKSADSKPSEYTTAESQIADSFLDKSFQIRFHVPPPMLSDWKSFVFQLVKQALPNHSQEDGYSIYKVYDNCRARTGIPPTPRELKTYVNQIGAIHRQWQDSFPLRHVAFYVLQLRDAKSVISRLRDNVEFPSKTDVSLLGADIRDSLASLAFNVEPSKGTELLLAEPIYQALAAADGEKLTSLESNNPEGFWAVLETVAESRLPHSDSRLIATAATCLMAFGLTSKDRREVNTIVEALSKLSEFRYSWLPFDLKTAHGIAALLQIVNSLNFSRSMLLNLLLTIDETNDKSDDPADLLSVIEPVFVVLRKADSLNHLDAFFDGYELPISAEKWPEACELILKLDTEGRFLEYLRPSVDFESISSVLEIVIDAGEFSLRHLSTMEITNKYFENALWTTVTERISQRLDSRIDVGSSEALHLFHGLHFLRRIGFSESTTKLKQLSDEGHVLHHLHKALVTSKHLPDCLAMLLYTFLSERPDANKPAVAGNSESGHIGLLNLLASEDPDVAKKLVGTVDEFAEYDFFSRVIKARSVYDGLIKASLRLIADSERPERVITPEMIVDSWAGLKVFLDDDARPQRFAELVQRLSRSTELCDLIMKSQEGFSSSQAGLYQTIVQNAVTEDAPKAIGLFATWCVSCLEQMSKERWVESLDGDFACSRLASDLARQNMRPTLRSPFCDALVDHASKVVDGSKVPPEDLHSKWGDMLECISDPASRKELRDRLLKVAESKDGMIDPSFFALYGDEICGFVAYNANDDVGYHLLSPLLRQRNAAGLKWLLKVVKDNPQCLQNTSENSAIFAFKNRLQDCLSDPKDDDAQPVIQQIADVLGIS